MIKQLCELAENLINNNEKYVILNPALTYLQPTLLLALKNDGSFVNFSPNEKQSLCEVIIRSNNVLPRILVDTPEYLLGIDKDGNQSKKIEDKFNKFKEKNKSYFDIPALSPILQFYLSNRANQIEFARKKFLELSKKSRNNSLIAFSLPNGQLAHNIPEVLNKIDEDYDAKKNKAKSIKAMCSICGEKDKYISPIHEKIKKVPGGKTSGNSLVSFNDPSTWSYGMKQSINSRICDNCAKKYVEATKWLMANKRGERFTNRKNFGDDTAVVFWIRPNMILPEIDLLDEPNVENVKKLLISPYNINKNSLSINDDPFYSLTVSGVGSRIVVRDWIEYSLDEIKENLKCWFKDIELCDGSKKLYSPISAIANSCKNNKNKITDNNEIKDENNEEDEKVRKKHDSFSSRFGEILWKCAITNHHIPIWVLSAVLNRIKIDKQFYPSRMRLIKLIINRLNKEGDLIMPDFDLENKNTAYLCGRLLAVLADIQQAALGDVNAGVVDRFYSSASTTPSVAFGRLVKNAQYHLSKLKSESPGLAITLEKKLTEIMGELNDFPQTFKLEDQGRFAIGFYHHQQLRFSKNKQNAKEGETL